MNKLLILLFLFSIVPFTACDDNDKKEEQIYVPELPEGILYDPNHDVCGTTDAMENLRWLREIPLGVRKVFVKEYQGQDYLMIDEPGSSMKLVIGKFGHITGAVYDCQGNYMDDDSEVTKTLRESFSNGEDGWVCICNADFFYEFDNE